MVVKGNWFEVDREGLKQLQAGKPKHYLIRELIQNAWDENVKVVKVELQFDSKVTTLTIEDDNPEGFKDLKDSYTLFKETSKRLDPSKRGRFNLGEKQVFSICERALVETTKGCVEFNECGRVESPTKRQSGSKVSIQVKLTQEEYDEILESVKTYLVPKGIEFYVNRTKYNYQKPVKTFTSKLSTEISDGEMLKRVDRNTLIELYKRDVNYLYEMGIPVMEIKCEYSINVCQKIPLGSDRETVPQFYLQDLYSEVLNNTYDDISEDDSSQTWIKDAMCDDRINREAVSTILTKRFGDKVCVADPFDPNSIDEAISKGFRVIRGNELSKEEWGNVKRFGCLDSSSSLFGKDVKMSKPVKPTPEQVIVADYAKLLAKELLHTAITVVFINDRDIVPAQFGGTTLTFNIGKLGKDFFFNKLETTSLILHEIAHYYGNHTEYIYQEKICEMAQKLILIALERPKFFEEKK